MPFMHIPEFRLPSFHSMEFHTNDPPHSVKQESEGGGAEKPSSPMVKPGTNPFSLSSSSSGLSPSSNPMKSTMHNIKLPNDAGHYSVRDVSEQNGTYALYKRDPKTEAPSNTGKFVKPDGHGGWEVVPSGSRLEESATQSSGSDSAPGTSQPALPPAAKIGPRQLGPLNDKRVYPGGDGNSYVRRGNDYRQVIYDQQIKGWRMVDPDRPNDLSRSVPVALDGDGGATPLPKAALKGGGGPLPPGNTIREQLNRARESEQDARRRVNESQTALNQAEQRAHDSSTRYHADDELVKQISNDVLTMERERQPLQQSLRREQDPVRREGIQERINSITQGMSSLRGVLHSANAALDRSFQQYANDLRQQSEAARMLARNQHDLHSAIQQVQHFQGVLQATPSPRR